MKRKLFLTCLILTIIISLVPLITLIIFIFYFLSNMKGWGMIPPQDCSGVSFTVKGVVIGENGIPIEGASIRAFNNGSYELPPFDVLARSNQGGYFETESITSFACTEFTIEISASGYQDQSVTYYPPGEDWPDEIPKSLIITLNATENGP